MRGSNRDSRNSDSVASSSLRWDPASVSSLTELNIVLELFYFRRSCLRQIRMPISSARNEYPASSGKFMDQKRGCCRAIECHCSPAGEVVEIPGLQVTALTRKSGSSTFSSIIAEASSRKAPRKLCLLNWEFADRAFQILICRLRSE